MTITDSNMIDNRTTELVSRREATTLLEEFLCGYQNILLTRGINASEAVRKQNELIDEYADTVIELIDKAQTARDNGYTEGFDNGVKACLQQLEGIFMNAGGIIDVEDWVSEQWKEYES